MNEKRRLLAAVCETPEDDAPRLVYADWLEEYGDEAEQAHAEFIRVQVALAKMEESDPARPPLVLADRRLLDAHLEAWTKEAPEGLEETEFRRGFIESATMSAADFVKHGERILDRVPLRSLCLQDDHPRLASCRTLRRLARLDAGDGLPSLRLLGSPHLQKVRSLDVSDDGWRVEELADAAAAWPDSIEEIDLSDNALDGFPSDLRWPASLRVLRIRTAELETADARALARTLAGVPLRVLDLEDNNIGDAGLAALLAVPGLAASLEVLNVAGNDFRAGMPRHLARAPFSRLRELRTGVGLMSLRGVRHLAESPHLSRLERLGIPFALDEASDESVELILASPHLRNVRWLDLSGSEIGPDGARAFAEDARGFWHLDLYSNAIGDEGAEAFAESPHLRGLQMLNLHDNGLGPAGMAALLRSENLRSMLDLDLTGHYAGKKVLESLVAGPLSPFANVEIGPTRASAAKRAAVDKFKARLAFR